MKFNELRILITGGAGFIGSHTAAVLAKDNFVTIYDNFDSAVVPQRELHKNDIRSPLQLARAMKGVDVVFHFAVSCVRISLTTPEQSHEVNATGTLKTLIAAKKAGVKRFVYISSSEVYGSAKEQYISEHHAIAPMTVYGMSKYMGELYTNYFNDKEGLPGVVVRPFNAYGPRCHFDGIYGEVIPRFVVRALCKKQPIIFGNGTQTRDFTYIDDTARGILLAASSDRLNTPVNIAYGKEISINDLARTICKICGIPFRPVYKPPRPQDVARHAADITKAKKLLKFTPTISIEVGLGRYIDWVRTNYPDVKKLEHLVPEKNW